MRRLALIAALILCCMATPARAAKTTPGNSCTAGQTNQFVTSGGKETGGIVYFLVCDGTHWQPFGVSSHASNNAGFGYGVLYASGGTYNSAFGNGALSSSSLTGYADTAVGYGALTSNTSGNNNSAFGVNTLYYTTGSNNTGIGYATGGSITTGGGNVAIGFAATSAPTTGLNNILIGAGQGYGGNTADTPAAGTSNFLNIGNAIFATGITGTVAAPAGNVGIGTTSPQAALDISNGGNTLFVGADNAATTRTNNTPKLARITVPQDVNADGGSILMMGYNTSGANDVYMGGGTSLYNAATGLHFDTAANAETTTGTERMTISSTGKISATTTLTGDGILVMNNTATTGFSPGLYGTSSSATGPAIYGSTTTGVGVESYATGNGGAIYGECQGTGSGYGVQGEETGASNTGYAVEAASTTARPAGASIRPGPARTISRATSGLALPRLEAFCKSATIVQRLLSDRTPVRFKPSARSTGTIPAAVIGM